ncbi:MULTISPECIES: IPT/TIG domain-containing protein [Acidobacterium]|uniref:Putative lipoprotein n=1 Tax=Acidobacterium capsulatum (strain ATCC 51196 / DSM 11244 / BCRC 80197 / JCM 7670 / NBRC 15755 / NCIMB 13165 / 161) TaxID=240015 RepID=C1F2P2_ACIC5|nr:MULTISPECIES: IPT/TIG domain-containing protein [Acidobacterium]ACO33124.1 putative lipoprotein [Acidobacterium capsulatum ATCC 51196]
MRKSMMVFGLLWVAAVLGGGCRAWAGGPHWYGGSAYFDPAVMGQPIVWKNGQITYYTDQGNLSATVSQTQANSMVAAAAAVWSGVKTAAVSIGRGGSLAEDVSGTNVYQGSNGLVEPADIQASDTAVPVAVVYDADGSVINAIYGPGASATNDCQNDGVMTIVDGFSTTGYITHAVMLVNGLCTANSTEMANLQYQMIRSFGRILGLDWSDANEAMFVNDQITSDGLAGWPILHPVEHLCSGTNGACMTNETTLRYDDIASLNRTYPVTAANHAMYASKTLTASATFSVQGTIRFRRGQGMQGVNVVLRPLVSGQPILLYTVTAVSGASYVGDAGNPVDGNEDASGNPLNRFGSDDQTLEGYYDLSGVPLPPGMSSSDYELSFEAINPNYVAEYSVGPYVTGQVTPSGTMPVITLPGVQAGIQLEEDVTISDSADELHSGDDGTEQAPLTVSSTGQWTGRLCCYGHTSWFQWWARANREFTVEVQALDDAGANTENKLQPVIGLWNGNAVLGTSPVTGTLQPFNGAVAGLTTLSAVSTAGSSIRLGIADARGDGRPDYAYRGRVIYADTVSPARLPATGGPIVIRGMGFSPNMTVTVNGVAAQVTAVTPNEIDAVAPPSNGTVGTVLLDVEDPVTLGVASIGDGLAYDAQNGDGLTILAAPSGVVPMNVPESFTVRALGPNLTPAAGIPVTFSVTEGNAALGCGATSCQVTTAADGTATIAVTANSTALAQVTAALASGADVLAEFTGSAPNSIYALTPNLYVAIGGTTTWSPSALVLENSQPAAGAGVLWQTTSSGVSMTSQAVSDSNSNGVATGKLTVGPLNAAAGGTVQACVVGNGSCTAFNIVPVHVETAAMEPVSGTSQSIDETATLAPAVLEVTDAIGHPMAGAVVTFHETEFAWAPTCAGDSVCPSPHILSQQTVQAISASDGTVSLTPMPNNGQAVKLVVQATVGASAEYDFELAQNPPVNP